MDNVPGNSWLFSIVTDVLLQEAGKLASFASNSHGCIAFWSL